MRRLLPFITAVAVAVSGAGVRPAAAAPRQIVVVVAEGLNPQVVDFGTAYLKKAFEPAEPTALEQLQTKAPAQAATGALPALRGLLKTAAASGYKTGIVTTGDVTAVAPLFYDLAADNADVARTLVTDTKFDFIAGGGRGHFLPRGVAGSLRGDSADLAKALKAAGGTPQFDVPSLDEEVRGKTLVLHGDSDLSYALDREAEQENSFNELVSLGLESLSANDAPFVLVVHDSLLAKAVAAHDTPAVAEQYHEIDGIVSSLLDKQEENPGGFGVAVVATSGEAALRFTTDDPQQRSDAYFILSNLPVSYAKAGARLRGADAAALDEFATEDYKGWKLSTADRAALLAGTLNPEAAIRAAYEPALKIGYGPAQPGDTVYSLGLGAPTELAQTLNSLVRTKPGPTSVVTATSVP